MKTKILLTLSLSLFCLDGLARGKLRVGPGQGDVLKLRQGSIATTKTHLAFKTQPELESFVGCKKTCTEIAEKFLNPKGVTALNHTPHNPKKTAFTKNLSAFYRALFEHHHYNTKRKPSSFKKVTSQVESIKKEVLNGTTALALAIQKSEGWPQTAKDNLAKFTKDLLDGVSPKEAEKLERVKRNCR